MANGQGGLILLGVEDDGTITGLAPRHGSTTEPQLLQAMIINKTESPVATRVEIYEVADTPESVVRYVPTAEVVFQELRGDSVAVNDTTTLPLFRAAERLFELIDVRNFEQELMVGLHRIGIPRVPVGTIRESIANALVHRDYSELGPVAVQLNDQTFRVRSPGGFPAGITLQNFLDDSKPRSAILAEAFKRAGIVDRAGRGIREMYRQLLRTGRGVLTTRRRATTL